MVNFDNAATSFPKPQQIKTAANMALIKYGGNPSRGGHKIAMEASKAVFAARENVADFFGAQCENTIFTLNCTYALNIAIKGIMNDGGHIIISSLEHNSVSRPVYALSNNGRKRVDFSIAKVYPNDKDTIQSFRELITPRTKAIACTLASNVTGQILPYKEIAQLCAEKGICFIADGAQACGIIKVSLSDGINILCTSGHKGLYGSSGTGLIITDGKFPIIPIIEGGTGSSSLSLNQPDVLPESLESGTLNTVGIITLSSGIDFIKKYKIEKIYEHENALCENMIKGLSKFDGCEIYRNKEAKYVPIVSFNISGYSPEEIAEHLDKAGFCLRAGYHCAALAHSYLGTSNGTIRFAPSVFNSNEETIALLNVLKKLKTK